MLLQGGRPVVEDNRICAAGGAFEFRGGTEPQLGNNEICQAQEG
jgi:hypothetical protein